MNIFKCILSYMAGLVAFFSLSPVATLEAIWNPPVYISPLELSSNRPDGPQLDVNLQNRGVVIFASNSPDQSGFTLRSIFSSSYAVGSGWSPVVKISSEETIIVPPNNIRPKYFDQGDPVIAMNNSGYCVAAWEGFLNTEFDTEYDVIITNVRSSDGTWSTVRVATVLSEDVNVENPFLAVNDAGLAVMVWVQFDRPAGITHTMASFLPFGGVWTTPVILDSYIFREFEKTPRVSIDPNGNVVASWQTGDDESNYEIHAATYDVNTGLWTVVVLDPLPENFSYTYNAIDPNGNAVVTWTRRITQNPFTFQVMSSFFTPGIGWSVPVAVSNVNLSQEDANVTIDAFGNATATWGNSIDVNNVRIEEVYASRKPFGGNWSIPVLISTPGLTSTVDNDLVNRTIDVDNEGNVITIMKTRIGNDQGLQSAYYSIQAGWQPPQTINAPRLSYNNIGLGTCGFALAIWDETTVVSEQPFTVLTRVKGADNFNVGIAQAPSDLSVSSCCDKFASQKICNNILRWDPSPCASSYRLYRNGVLIADIPVGGLTTFTDFYCVKIPNVTYTLSYVNIFGIESPFTSVVVP